jgi:hypothetical protein
MVRSARPREWMDKASGLRDQMVLSLEDWIPYVLNPKGKEDEIFAIAALTRVGRPDSDAHIISFLGRPTYPRQPAGTRHQALWRNRKQSRKERKSH